MDVINTDELTAYLPGVNVPAESAELYVQLTNDEITRVLGDLSQIPSGAKRIALEVAARPARTAGGYTSVTKSFDDTSTTWRREGSGAERAGVYLTDAERGDLLGLLGRASPKARSIRLAVP